MLRRRRNKDSFVTRKFIGAVDRAVQIQTAPIRAYTDATLRSNDGDLGAAQRAIDKHFMGLATGTGVGTGGVAVVPGIGTVAAVGAVGLESVVLLELCAWYVVASARLHGVDISDAAVRRDLVLLAFAGASGSKALSSMTGQRGLRGLMSLPTSGSAGNLSLNSTLGTLAFRNIRRRLGTSMTGKLLPFGAGAYLGARANRATANRLVTDVHGILGDDPVPTT